MTLYAWYDPTQPAPQPVLGWFDTNWAPYTDLPVASALLELTEDQWEARTAQTWGVSGGTLVPAPALAAPT